MYHASEAAIVFFVKKYVNVERGGTPEMAMSEKIRNFAGIKYPPQKAFRLIMEVDKVLYISQEIAPYLPQNVMSGLCRDLPQGIQELGVEVRTFMPRYGAINERRNQLHEVIRLSGLNIVIDDTDHPLIIKVATLQPSRMQVYFIDSDDYFQRHNSGALETQSLASENDERLMFFARGVLETVRKLRWPPVVIHCSGWISALVPLYIRKSYAKDPAFRNVKVVYSLFADEMESPLDARAVEKLRMDGFSAKDLAVISGGPVDTAALHRIAIQYSDGVVQAVADAPVEAVEAAKASGKSFMAFPSEEGYAAAYMDFYKNL